MYVLIANEDISKVIQYHYIIVNLVVSLISNNKDKLLWHIRFSPAPSNVLYSCIY